jgi:hypothetical protein
MNPLLDQIVVALIVAAALGWFIWRALRKRRRGGTCDAGCGCGTKKPLG